MADGSDEAGRTAPLAMTLLGAGLVAATDALARRRVLRRPVLGVLDETAHIGTGLLVLGASAPRGPEFEAALLAGSVLLDLDHVPDILGSRMLRAKRMRPAPHSLATLIALRLATRRGGPASRGALVGLTAHLARDLATGTNSVPLLWPLSKRPFSVRYGVYAAGLAALAGIGAARRDGNSGAPTPAPPTPADITKVCPPPPAS